MSDPKPLTSAALHELVFLSDPHLSGDGRRGFCVRTTIETPDEGPPAYRKQVCEVDLEAGGVRVVAEGRTARTTRASPPTVAGWRSSPSARATRSPRSSCSTWSAAARPGPSRGSRAA